MRRLPVELLGFAFLYCEVIACSWLGLKTLWLLASNPEAQTKLRQEVKPVFEHFDGRPDYKALKDMPWLDAVVCAFIVLAFVSSYLILLQHGIPAHLPSRSHDPPVRKQDGLHRRHAHTERDTPLHPYPRRKHVDDDLGRGCGAVQSDAVDGCRHGREREDVDVFGGPAWMHREDDVGDGNEGDNWVSFNEIFSQGDER